MVKQPPAGFGKTTLLSEWSATLHGRVAWLSLDPGENDLTRFFGLSDQRSADHRGQRGAGAVGRAPVSWGGCALLRMSWAT